MLLCRQNGIVDDLVYGVHGFIQCQILWCILRCCRSSIWTFILFLSHTPARCYLSVELGFIVCFRSSTSCITSPLESTPFFIPSTSLCSLSSWLTSSYVYHLSHHSHQLRSHHLSLPPPFTPDLKLISFTNPFLHSHSFRTDFTDLNLLY